MKSFMQNRYKQDAVFVWLIAEQTGMRVFVYSQLLAHHLHTDCGWLIKSHTARDNTIIKPYL